MSPDLPKPGGTLKLCIHSGLKTPLGVAESEAQTEKKQIIFSEQRLLVFLFCQYWMASSPLRKSLVQELCCSRLLTSRDECEDDRDPVSLEQDVKLSKINLHPDCFASRQISICLNNRLLLISYSPYSLCDITNGTGHSHAVFPHSHCFSL